MATQKVRPDPGALERQTRVQRRRVATRTAGAFAVVAGLVIAGLVIGFTTIGKSGSRPAAPGPTQAPSVTRGLPPTIDRLQGVWYEDTGTGAWPEPLMASFSPDGSFTLGAVVSSNSWLYGTYRVEGRTIVFTASGGGWCESRDVFTWDAGIVADGRLEAVFKGTNGKAPTAVGECPIPIGEPYNFSRVSPTSPAAAGITPGAYLGTSITADTQLVDLQGMWLVEGTGQLLRLEWSGGYLMDDSGQMAQSPFDEGTIEVGKGSFTFTSGSASRGCAEGDVMVWKNLTVEDGRLRGVVGQDSCGRDIPKEFTLLFLPVNTP